MNTTSTHLLTLFACIFATVATDSHAADDTGEELKKPVRVIVKVPHAAVMAGEKKLVEAPLGTLIEYTRIKGNWRFIPQFKGWVHKGDLVLQNEAVEEFTKLVKKEKPTANDFHLRGIAYMSEAKWGMALLDLEKSYDLGEGSVPLHFNLGTCYRQLEDYPAALKEFTEIIKNFPDEFPAVMARGSILSEQGHWDAALKDFDVAIKLDPKSATARNFRGVALRMLGRFEEAEAEYSTAIELDEELATAYANRAYVLKGLKQYDKAFADYEKSLELDDEVMGVQNDFAWFLATCPKKKFRDSKRAVKLAKQVCKETENKNGEYLDTLAAAYAAEGDFSKAEETANEALQLLKGTPSSKSVYERAKLYSKEKPYIDEES